MRTASYLEFVAVWDLLPESRRESWRRQFETGYEEVAKAERLELLRAFTSHISTNASDTCLRGLRSFFPCRVSLKDRILDCWV